MQAARTDSHIRRGVCSDGWRDGPREGPSEACASRIGPKSQDGNLPGPKAPGDTPGDGPSVPVPGNHGTKTKMKSFKRNAGFTLIELMIVVAIIAIIASVAIPRLMAARLSANESAAISTLRSLTSAQAQVQSSGAIDTDGDGAGEYGGFGELAGTIPSPAASATPVSRPPAPPVWTS
jgi:prepilin-type N-terminal cleavage/methylation domain-containing protein